MARTRKTQAPSTQASATALDAAVIQASESKAIEDAVAQELYAKDMNMLEWMEGQGNRMGIVDPLSDEGLRLQALYVSQFSQHPMDVLRRIMENPFSDPKDRMSCAKSLMEYTLRKPTQDVALRATAAALSIDANRLSALSASELELLEKLLSKASAGT